MVIRYRRQFSTGQLKCRSGSATLAGVRQPGAWVASAEYSISVQAHTRYTGAKANDASVR